MEIVLKYRFNRTLNDMSVFLRKHDIVEYDQPNIDVTEITSFSLETACDVPVWFLNQFPNLTHLCFDRVDHENFDVCTSVESIHFLGDDFGKYHHLFPNLTHLDVHKFENLNTDTSKLYKLHFSEYDSVTFEHIKGILSLCLCDFYIASSNITPEEEGIILKHIQNNRKRNATLFLIVQGCVYTTNTAFYHTF
jgi:hypothetical protein